MSQKLKLKEVSGGMNVKVPVDLYADNIAIEDRTKFTEKLLLEQRLSQTKTNETKKNRIL